MEDVLLPHAIVINELEDVPIPISVRADRIIFDMGLSTKTKKYENKIIWRFENNEARDRVKKVLPIVEERHDDIYLATLFDEIYYSNSDPHFEIHPYSQKRKKVIYEYKENKTKQQKLW